MNSTERASAIFELRGELLKKGLTLQGFARAEGFDIRTVFAVIKRYWGTREISPRGAISRAILARLRAYVDSEHPEPPCEPEGEEESPVPGVGGEGLFVDQELSQAFCSRWSRKDAGGCIH